MDAIFAAADFSGLTINVQTLLLGFVGLTTLFVGYRYFKKAANRA